MTRMNILILTGAGISAESGIATFRDSDGLWENHKVEEVATPRGFKNNPDLVHRFYNERRQQMASVFPNDAHKALAELQREWLARGRGFMLVTQNIDNLHEQGGAENVLHMHGEIHSIKCVHPKYQHKQHWTQDTDTTMRCPDCNSRVRPDVVWFEEMPYHLNTIDKYIDQTDIFISIGTSGVVAPASTFAGDVRHANRKAEIIEVNLKGTGSPVFDRVLEGPATVTVPQLVKELLER